MKFIEEKLEKAFAEWLGQEGFRRMANATKHSKQWATE